MQKNTVTTFINKPWGYEKIWSITENYVCKLLLINPGQRLSKQYHETKEESIFVIEGMLVNYDKDNKKSCYLPGEFFHVEAGQIHRFGSTEDSYVKIIEVSTNHLHDIVRIEDDYGRVNYEK